MIVGRVNVFIGEPNIGKSNILEVIGLLSHVVYGSICRFCSDGKLVRFILL